MQTAPGLGGAPIEQAWRVERLRSGIRYRIDEGHPAVAAVIDARRGQVYVRLFRDGRPLGQAEALSLEMAAERISDAAASAPPILVGSGASLLVETFPERLGAAVTARLPAPSPEALAYMTAVVDPTAAPPRPLYLRAPDAVPPSRLPGQPRAPATS